MKVLLLGKDGQLGRALQRRLAGQGEVVALGRAEADLAVPGLPAGIVARHQPEVIVNAAAYTAVDRAESEPESAARVNAAAVDELAAAAAACGAWLIHYSTDYVFDGKKPGPYLETDPTQPLSVYGQSKRAGEVAIAASGCRHLVFRTSWVHAPGHANFIATILRLAAERDSLAVVDDQVGAPTGARLIAEVTAAAIAFLAEKPPPSGIYHLAAAGETSWYGYARFIVAEARAAGARLRLAPEAIAAIASADYPQAARRPANSRLDTTSLRSTFGLDLPDWRDDVRETVRLSLAEAAA